MMSTSKGPGAFTAYLLILFIVVSGSPAVRVSDAKAQSNYRLRAHVIGAAGSPAASTGYRSDGTLGQPTPIGIAAKTNQELYAGYWGQVRSLTPTGTLAPVTLYNQLFQNYPNPFNPSTTIKYSVARSGPVEIKIFNVRGQKVKTLINENKLPGAYRVSWDGRNEAGTQVASGVYFYRLRIGTFHSVKKLVLLK